MKITVRLFAHFLSHLPNKEGGRESVITLSAGSTIAHLMEHLRLPAELPKVILVNGTQKDAKDELYDGDIVSIFPPLGGG